VAEPVAGLHASPGGNAPGVVHVQVDQRPAGVLVAVAVQVEDHIAVAAAGNDAGRGGGRPVRRDVARALLLHQFLRRLRRSEVNRAPGRSAVVRAVRPAGEDPFLPLGKGQRQRRLDEIGRHDRLKRARERVAEQAEVRLEEAAGVHIALPLGGAGRQAEHVLHGDRPGVEHGVKEHALAVAQGHGNGAAIFPPVIAEVERVGGVEKLLEQPLAPLFDNSHRVEDFLLGGIGVGQPLAAIFQQRQQQARVDAVRARDEIHDFDPAPRLLADLFGVGAQEALAELDRAGDAEAAGRRAVDQLAVRDQLEGGRGYAPAARHADQLAHFQPVGVGQVVEGQQIVYGDGVERRDGAQGFVRLDGVHPAGGLGVARHAGRGLEGGGRRLVGRHRRRGDEVAALVVLRRGRHVDHPLAGERAGRARAAQRGEQQGEQGTASEALEASRGNRHCSALLSRSSE